MLTKESADFEIMPALRLLNVHQHFGTSINDGVLDIRFIFSRNGSNFTYIGGDRGAFVSRGHGVAGSIASLVNGVEINGVSSAWDAGLVYMYRGALDVGDGNLILHYFGQQGTHARQDGTDRGEFGKTEHGIRACIACAFAVPVVVHTFPWSLLLLRFYLFH